MKKIPFIWLIYVFIVLIIWFSYMFINDTFFILAEHFEIMVTMLFGSFIAGASSEGGGAIAFPVFTLLLDLTPSLSRNFSLAIQSIGMTSASIFILEKGIPIEKKVILYGALGGILGFSFGAVFLTGLIAPPLVKLLFVSIWLSFSFVLFTNKTEKKASLDLSLKSLFLLVFFGFLGGVISAFFGNGLDILLFSILTLLFQVREKVATPTSVILMAILSIFGFIFHVFVLNDFEPQCFSYWLSAIPVVILFAPLGAYLISLLSNRFIRNLLIGIIMVQYVGAMIIIKPTYFYVVLSLMATIVAFLFFYLLKKKGNNMKSQEYKKAQGKP